MDEKAAIERELVLAGKLVIPERYHPGYDKTCQEDHLNHNRLLFFTAQNPRMKLAIAGVPKDPLQIDPPGCGSPFDALKFPDRLVEVLSRGVPLHGWDAKSFKKIPKHLMDKINPDDLLRCQKSTRRAPAPSMSPIVDGQVDTISTLLDVEISTSNIRNSSNGGLQDMNSHHLKDPQAYSFVSSTQEESFLSRPSIRIPIPDHLKNLLVDDWENVTKSLLLVPIPSQAPANFIIDSYFNEEKSHRRLGSAEADVLEEFCAGMKVYFEKSVGKILLYRFERAQLAEVSVRVEELDTKYDETNLPRLPNRLESSGKAASTPTGKAKGQETRMVQNISLECLVYHAHSSSLLLLNWKLTSHLVNMPEMIAQTNMDVQSVNRLREEISKFCTWLARNSSKYFCAKYEKPTAEYIDSAR